MRIKYKGYVGQSYYDGKHIVRDFYRNGELYVRIKYYPENADIYNRALGLRYFVTCVYSGEIMIAKAVNFDLMHALKFGFM